MASHVGLALLGIIFFGFAMGQWCRRYDVADILWGPNFCILAWVVSDGRWPASFLGQLTFVLLLFWALRLSIYLAWRSARRPEDARYRKWRQQWGPWAPFYSLLKIFGLQALVMVVVFIPVGAVMLTAAPTIGWYSFWGVLLLLLGLVWESCADWELAQFKARPENEGKICLEGPWGQCRHPNYLGEILVWWGFAFLALGSDRPWPVLFLSPLLMTFLLLKVSGAPMLAEQWQQRGLQLLSQYQSIGRAIIPFSLAQLYSFLLLLVAIILLDYLWLGLLLKDFYRTQAQAFWQVQIWPAIPVYLLLPLGLLLINQHISSLPQKVLRGALFGLVIYGVYNFTNLALIGGWPLEMSLLDIVWGTALGGASTLFASVISNISKLTASAIIGEVKPK